MQMIFRAAFCLVRLRSPDKKQAIRGSAPASFFRFTPERLRRPYYPCRSNQQTFPHQKSVCPGFLCHFIPPLHSGTYSYTSSQPAVFTAVTYPVSQKKTQKILKECRNFGKNRNVHTILTVGNKNFTAEGSPKNNPPPEIKETLWNTKSTSR